MSDRNREAERGPASRLHFEDAPQKDSPVTSGQNVQRSRRSHKPVPGKETKTARDAPDSRLRFEDADAPGATPPQDTPPASGQNVLKSKDGGRLPGGGKLKQDRKKARPSDRLRHEDKAPPSGGDSAAPNGESAVDSGSGAASDSSPRPGGKKAAREDRRFEKSKLRMDKSGGKLDKARDRLAKQKPPKKPGPVKTAGRAAGRSVHGYIHKKIYQVEHENVGIEAAHRTELAGEVVVRGGTRFIKRRIRTRLARRVRKWEKKNIKARADHTFRTMAREHPELNKNALSRFWYKKKIKKQYQKQARRRRKKRRSLPRKSPGQFFASCGATPRSY